MSRYLNLNDRFGSTLRSLEDLGRLPADQLVIDEADRTILRELARKKHEYANLPEMETNRKLWRATNDLNMIKPPVYINEICWPELAADPDLQLRCTHPFARELEEFLRQELYCHEHGFGNQILEDYIESPLVVYDSGFGIDEEVDTIHTDRNAEVVSRRFHILIANMDDIEKIHAPEIYLDLERTAQYTELMEDIFKDVIEIRQVGARGLWFTPWDYLIRVMGVQTTMYNLVDEPEFVEAAVKRYVDCAMRSTGSWASGRPTTPPAAWAAAVTAISAAWMTRTRRPPTVIPCRCGAAATRRFSPRSAPPCTGSSPSSTRWSGSSSSAPTTTAAANPCTTRWS